MPRQVRALAAALGERVGHYHLVSSISAYAGFGGSTTDESAALQTLEDPDTETISAATYGGLKALCEAAALEAFEGRCLVSRPGLIVGPHDPTGRFTWWVQRLARGGEVLAPGEPDAPVQCIDARDAAAWHLLQAERGSTGVYNLTGPAVPTTMSEFLATAIQALGSVARCTWASEAFLLTQGVAPWTDLPLWLPSAQAGMHRADITRALATGLKMRPLAETVTDTAAWATTAPPPVLGGPMRPQIGLSPEREAALLAAWRATATR